MSRFSLRSRWMNVILALAFFSFAVSCWFVISRDSAELAVAPPGPVLLQFPEDRSLGQILTRPWRKDGYAFFRESLDDWQPHADANGKIEIPAGMDVKLEISVGGMTDLSPLRSLPPDGIRYVSCWGIAIESEQVRHMAHLTGLWALNLEGGKIDDGVMQVLETLPELRYLNLDSYGSQRDGWGIGDKTLSVVAKLPHLVSLNLRGTRISDEGLTSIAGMKLKFLDLADTGITDAGLEPIGKMTTLIELYLAHYPSEFKLTDAGIKHIANLTNLKYLRAAGVEMTDAGLESLRSLTKLEEISIDGTQITEAGLAHLRPFASLQRVRLSVAIGDEGAKHLSKLPALKDIDGRLEEITDAGVALLADCPRLEKLMLGRHVTDESLKHVGRMKSLKRLWVQGAEITDDGLAGLRSLPSLSWLLIEDTPITGRGLEHIAAIPKVELLQISFRDKTMAEGRLDLKGLPKLKHVQGLRIGFMSTSTLRNEDLSLLSGLTQLEELAIDTVLDDAGLKRLTTLKNLKRFQCEQGLVSDAGLAELANFPELESITISGLFTDAGLARFPAMPKLRDVHLASPRVSETGLQALSAANPSLQQIYRMRFHIGYTDMSWNDRDQSLRAGKMEERQELDQLEGLPAPALTVGPWLQAGSPDPTLESLRGRVVLLDFWGVWCGPCRAAMPKLTPLHAAYSAQGLTIIGVHTTSDGEKMPAFLQENAYPWTFAVDQAEATVAAYHVPHYPSYYLIDREGKLRFAGLHPHELERTVKLLCAEPAEAKPNQKNP